MTGTVDADDASAPADGTDPTGTDPEYHAARAALYGLVGGAFVYPDEDVLAELTAPEAREGVEQAAERLDLREEVETLVDALEATDAEAMASAYNRLFGLPDGGEYPVVPYEGHYTTGSEVSEEQRRIATVVGLMEQFGVTPGEEFHERQDHVAAELELLQVVAAQRATAAHEGKDETARNLGGAEATILDEHLVGFVPAFARDVREASDDEVYRAAATLAERLVREDHRRHSQQRERGQLPETGVSRDV
jgi:TorA-specific chaperone